jgi:hypothetical protein
MDDAAKKAVEPLGYPVPEIAQRMGLGKNQGYEAAKAGTIPTLRIGKRLIVPAWFVKQLENGKAA